MKTEEKIGVMETGQRAGVLHNDQSGTASYIDLFVLYLCLFSRGNAMRIGD